jgi:hypothetical protein
MPKPADNLDNLPLRPPDEPGQPTPAPAWLALVAAWAGLIMFVASLVFVFLPGTRQPRAELEHAKPYSIVDRYLPVPMYGTTVAMFLGIVVLWQMRKLPRPLPQPMVMQRLQAWTGVALALLGAMIIYIDIGVRRWTSK